MATELTKGQNTPLAAGRVLVTVEVALPSDISALLVTAQGTVRSDADFVFYNQPTAAGVNLRPAAGSGPAAIDIDVAALPPEIEKVRIVASLDGTGQRFGQVAPPVARVSDAAGTLLTSYVVSGLTTETIMIALELYRRAGAWKVRAVGQGYAGGLADLIADHGVVVDGPAPQPTVAQPTVAQPGYGPPQPGQPPQAQAQPPQPSYGPPQGYGPPQPGQPPQAQPSVRSAAAVVRSPPGLRSAAVRSGAVTAGSGTAARRAAARRDRRHGQPGQG